MSFWASTTKQIYKKTELYVYIVSISSNKETSTLTDVTDIAGSCYRKDVTNKKWHWGTFCHNDLVS